MAQLLAEALATAGFEVRTASDADTARRVIDDFDPDVALLDIGLGDGPTGVHLAHALRKVRPDIAVLILSQHPDPSYASGSRLPEDVGFLRKHLVSDILTLVGAIDAVLADHAREVRQEERVGATELELSDQLMRVLVFIAKGYDNQSIADRLEISLKSVERRVNEIYSQLGIQTRGNINPRVEAARAYMRAFGLPERSP